VSGGIHFKEGISFKEEAALHGVKLSDPPGQLCVPKAALSETVQAVIYNSQEWASCVRSGCTGCQSCTSNVLW
jgi:hypothetical protein